MQPSNQPKKNYLNERERAKILFKVLPDTLVWDSLSGVFMLRDGSISKKEFLDKMVKIIDKVENYE